MDKRIKEQLSKITGGVNFEECESSNISAYGYDKNTHSIWILFKGNVLYEYPFATNGSHVYQGLVAAKSKGEYVNRMFVKTKLLFNKYHL